MTWLARGNALPIALLGAHTADHLARHPSGPTRVRPGQWVAAWALFAVVGAALRGARRGDRSAAALSTVSGWASFGGPLLAHAVPFWGPLSQASVPPAGKVGSGERAP